MKFFLALILLSVAAHAEFEMLSSRYITAYDFENRLVGYFSEVYRLDKNQYNCQKGLSKFGFSQPATGKPLSEDPNSDTIKTINDCLNESFESGRSFLNNATREQSIKFLGQFIPVSLLEAKIPANGAAYLANRQVKEFTKEEQDQIVAQTVETILGIDEVILSYGIIKDVSAYRAYLQSQLNQSETILQAVNKLTIQLALRDEFLTY